MVTPWWGDGLVRRRQRAQWVVQVKTAQPGTLSLKGAHEGDSGEGGGAARDLGWRRTWEEVWEEEPFTHQGPGPAGQIPAGLSVPWETPLDGESTGSRSVLVHFLSAGRGHRVPWCSCRDAFWTSFTLKTLLFLMWMGLVQSDDGLIE